MIKKDRLGKAAFYAVDVYYSVTVCDMYRIRYAE